MERFTEKEVFMNVVLKLGAVWKFSAALTLAALFAGCNQTQTPSSSTPSSTETQAVGDSITSELSSSSSTLTLQSGLQTLSLSGGAKVQAGRGCVTANPDPVVDTDKDGVPDNATFTFDCSSDRPVFSLTTKGTLQVSDPSGDAGTWGFDSTSDLTHTSTNKLKGLTVTETVKGSRSPRKTGDQIVQSHNITLTRTVGSEPTATVTNLWNLTFNAITPGSIMMGEMLTAGTMNIAGNFSFSKGDISRTWTLSTTTPLQYDPSCAEPLKIVAGTLRATVSAAGGNGYLEVQYGACGTEPVITRNFTPAS
jgi:hypothetical protein